MHILVIPSWYPDKHAPIRGIFFREQVLALQKAGHQVGVIVHERFPLRQLFDLRQWHKLWPRLIIENDAGVETYRVQEYSLMRVAPALGLTLFKRSMLNAFREYCQRQGVPQVIHAHSLLYGGYLATVVGQQRDIPIVLTEHSSVILEGKTQRYQKEMISECIDDIACPMAVGTALADALQFFQPDKKIQTIGNIVDADRFVPIAEPLALNPFVISSVALLVLNKRIDLLLDAFALAFKGHQVELRIGGNGPEQNWLEKRASKLGIRNQVVFLGALTKDEVVALMQNSHVVVSSSMVETFGITLIEAMACGKPVVATRSGGPEMFVTVETGILVPTDDVEALATGLQTMRREYDTYDPEMIRRYCLKNFSEKAIVEQLEAVYQEVIRE